jgi:ribosome recycling factor
MVKDAVASAKARMNKSVEDCRSELAAVRTGRATSSIFDHIKIEYYGTPTPLNQVATLGVPEPTMLTVQPWDPGLLSVIDKAIRSSDLGLNPMNDGKILRVPIPPLTEERRKDLVKHVHKVLENHRTAIRNIRRDSNEAIKKLLRDKKVSEDDEKRGLEEMQTMTDDFIKKIDALGRTKEHEILELK